MSDTNRPDTNRPERPGHTLPNDLKPETRLVHGGYDGHRFHGFVNPPVVHASTVLFASAQAHLTDSQRYVYGRHATPTNEALSDAISELEGAAGTRLMPSGVSAITAALLSVLRPGDHLLMVDNVYGPTRKFCDSFLTRMGIATTYYDPALGAGLEALMRPQTRAVFLEAPGSGTFEMQDVPAIVAVAARAGAYTLMDNTWATPLFFRPLEHGVDFSIQAATKYISGHSDVMIGTVAASPRAWGPLQETCRELGLTVGPDDVYLAYRGLKTMAVRLKQHQASGLKVARWLEGRPEVTRVRHPGLESDPGHALWKRDFSGACGLFAFETGPISDRQTAAFLDALTLFGMGYSWGGYESLAIRVNPAPIRTAVRWQAPGTLFRLHIGLEDPDDLMADLARGLAAMTAAA